MRKNFLLWASFMCVFIGTAHAHAMSVDELLERTGHFVTAGGKTLREEIDSPEAFTHSSGEKTFLGSFNRPYFEKDHDSDDITIRIRCRSDLKPFPPREFLSRCFSLNTIMDHIFDPEIKQPLAINTSSIRLNRRTLVYLELTEPDVVDEEKNSSSENALGANPTDESSSDHSEESTSSESALDAGPAPATHTMSVCDVLEEAIRMGYVLSSPRNGPKTLRDMMHDASAFNNDPLMPGADTFSETFHHPKGKLARGDFPGDIIIDIVVPNQPGLTPWQALQEDHIFGHILTKKVPNVSYRLDGETEDAPPVKYSAIMVSSEAFADLYTVRKARLIAGSAPPDRE